MLLTSHQSCAEVWGLQLSQNHKNLVVDSDGEQKEDGGELSGQPCAGQGALMKDIRSVAGDRCASPEAIYL
jgi:hypothetical protein